MNSDTLISIRALRARYESVEVLKGVDLDIRRGEMVALLGASGCGKTTLLRTLAGFVPASGGEVMLRGHNVLHMPPEQRGMVMMFQSYALWPHMSVAQNIGYGLRLKGLPSKEIARCVDASLAMLGLSGFGARKVTELSGGQRQRVALGRALAVEPEILLLDEPLSNLDAGIRHQMRHEIRAIQKKLGLTAILVTHDREEALAMADRIIVLNAGRIEQIGVPEDVFASPASPYVASFMGAGNEIRCHARVCEDRLQLVPEASLAAEQGLLLDLPLEQFSKPLEMGPGSVYFRSELACLYPPQQVPNDHLTLPGRVGHSSFMGHSYRCEVHTHCGTFMVDHGVRLDPDQDIVLCVPSRRMHFFSDAQFCESAPRMH